MLRRCIGIFGGTFDPVHNGHLRSAFELLERLPFDELRIVPCGDPPHRQSTVANAAQRLALLRIAIGTHAGFVVDDREIARDGPSYSVETLESLRADFPEASISLVIGMDAFLDLESWHRWDELLSLAHLVVAHRPGSEAPVEGSIAKFLKKHRISESAGLAMATSGHIYVHQVTQLEISSSAIRQLIAEGYDPRFLMPDAERQEIQDKAYYAAVPPQLHQSK